MEQLMTALVTTILLASALGSAIHCTPVALSQVKAQASSSRSMSASPVATKTDQAVMNAVLTDLLQAPDLWSSKWSSGTKFVLVARKPHRLSTNVRITGQPAGMGPSDMPQVSREIFDDQLARFNISDSRDDPDGKQRLEPEWARLKPSSKKVLIQDVDVETVRHAVILPDSEEQKRFRDIRGFIFAALPGYSKDGKTALVQLEVWQVPELIGIYVLRENRGKWKIEQKWLGGPIL
jgi:hypothetical protein